MKRISLLLFTGIFLLFIAAGVLDAATIIVNRPTSSNVTVDGLLKAAWEDNIEKSDSYKKAISTLSKFENQTDLARGFANANAYSSHAGTIQGYQNYDLFFVSIGVMGGLQAPSGDADYYNKDTIEDDLEADGDVHAGVALGVAINAGIHAKFIAYGLYLTGIFGRVDIGEEQDDYTFESTTIGGRINYALIQTHGILLGFLKWRGLSIGTGFIYQKAEASMVYEFDPISQSFSGGGVTGTMTVDPSARFKFETTTYTVPVDIVTSFQLLWLLNLTAGAGVDFVFGHTDLTLTTGGSVNTQINSGSANINPGSITITGETDDVSPDRVRPKIMAGLGLQLGPVKIDMPVIYYPSAGAAIGLTAAFVW
ncbi:MAG TPA: hypothetical protein PK200_09785 [Spirochaetota bacterium]|nr:hypothetical protein [Spirochaetota bacterium]